MLSTPTLNTITSLAKRRGFVFPASEIYGGIESVWDYGPLGVELKRNVKELWWKNFVKQRSNVFGLDSAIMQNPEVWMASGHTKSFQDPLRGCDTCKQRFNANLLRNDKCLACGGKLGIAKDFNLMFKTQFGPVDKIDNFVYLRPETAQGIFINFINVVQTTRAKLPFGVAQIGKSFRNEITTGNFIFRTREFEQMELEYFCHPGQADKFYAYWKKVSFDWFISLGIDGKLLRLVEHKTSELPHYAINSADLEFKFPWGWGELETVANRADYDLKTHSQYSGKNLTIHNENNISQVCPYVIEPAIGVDRLFLALIVSAYKEDTVADQPRVFLKLHPDLSPYQVAVLPLSRNEQLLPTAKKIFNILLEQFNCQYDETQSIGRRYRRQDEIGTVLAVTIDFDTINDNSVTIRDRNSTEQIRVEIPNLPNEIKKRLDENRANYKNL